HLLERVLGTVDRHMNTTGTAIYLWRGGYAPEASSFDGALELVPLNDPLPACLRTSPLPVDPSALSSLAAGKLAFPMMARGELVGFLTVTPKRIHYEAEDIYALSALAEATGLTLVTL